MTVSLNFFHSSPTRGKIVQSSEFGVRIKNSKFRVSEFDVQNKTKKRRPSSCFSVLMRITSRTSQTSTISQKSFRIFKDGLQYWKERGYHHPFRYPEYRGNGELAQRLLCPFVTADKKLYEKIRSIQTVALL